MLLSIVQACWLCRPQLTSLTQGSRVIHLNLQPPNICHLSCAGWLRWALRGATAQSPGLHPEGGGQSGAMQQRRRLHPALLAGLERSWWQSTPAGVHKSAGTHSSTLYKVVQLASLVQARQTLCSNPASVTKGLYISSPLVVNEGQKCVMAP